MTPLFLDTSFLIEYLRGRLFDLDDIILQVRQKNVFYNGIVLTELLSGIRGKSEKEKIKKLLAGLSYLPTQFDDFTNAGSIRNSLFKKGFSMSTPDSLIAAHAKRYSLKIITRDSFLMKIPELLNIQVEMKK